MWKWRVKKNRKTVSRGPTTQQDTWGMVKSTFLLKVICLEGMSLLPGLFWITRLPTAVITWSLPPATGLSVRGTQWAQESDGMSKRPRRIKVPWGPWPMPSQMQSQVRSVLVTDSTCLNFAQASMCSFCSQHCMPNRELGLHFPEVLSLWTPNFHWDIRAPFLVVPVMDLEIDNVF